MPRVREGATRALVSARDGRIVLEKTCPEHGAMVEELHDVLFREDCVSDRQGSPACTHAGARIRPVVRGLPKTVETLCPECGRNILGRVFDWRGNVLMEKTCPDHGYVKDRIYTGTELFLKMQQWSFREGAGLENPQVEGATHCPSACGLCNMHQSHTLLGQIDLTNRCNLSCPICFANANVQGYVSEPNFDEIVGLLEQLRAYRPVPASAVQFTGGEPTIHEDFLRIVRKAKELGFSHLQVASNGIQFAKREFALAAAEAGLHTIYLQFDGTDDAVYEYTRGRKLFETKLKALENIHAAGMKVCLVPTIVRGVNNDQVGKILQFAIDNIHVVSAIAYQPVSFTGRISLAEREAQRYTMGDLALDLAATGKVDPQRDFYPLSVVAPLLEVALGDHRGPEDHRHLAPDVLLRGLLRGRQAPQRGAHHALPRHRGAVPRHGGPGGTDRDLSLPRDPQAQGSLPLRQALQGEGSARGHEREELHARAQGPDRQEDRSRKSRREDLPDAHGGRHALPGPVQLRRRAREALRDPLLDARGHVPVLRVQLWSGAPRMGGGEAHTVVEGVAGAQGPLTEQRLGSDQEAA